MDITEENKEFNRKSGEILNMALHVETELEFFISNYFIKPQNAKTFFFNDIFMLKTNFDRKTQIFREICERESFEQKRIQEVIGSINFVKEIRNKVAHWQAEKAFDTPLRLRNRTTITYEKDILVLDDSLMKKIDEEKLKAIQGIDEFYLKYYKEGTVDEKQAKEIINYSDEEIFSYAKELIKCAEYDFSSAKILYQSENKQFPVILYHIQQTVEKLAKAELILRKQISIDILKKVNHRTPNAFMFSLDNALKDNEISPFLSPRVDNDALNKAKEYILNPDEIIKSDKETLLHFLNFYDIFKMLGIPEALYSEAIQANLGERLKKNPEERREIFMNLFFMSWITFFHEGMTRYPDGKLKPRDYNENLPFVQIIPDLLEKIEKILIYMKSYKFSESSN